MAEFQQSISKFSIIYFHFILSFAHNLIPWSSRLPLVGSSSSKLFSQLLFPPSLSPSPFPQRFENYIRFEEKKENIFHWTKKKVKILFVADSWSRGGRSFLKIYFFIEMGLKMILFKIQFKTKSKIFIQQIFIQLSTENSLESSFKRIWGKSFKIKKRPKYGFGALLRPLFGSRTTEMNWNRSH